MSGLRKIQYIKLKNLSYLIYLLDYKYNSNKAKNILMEEAKKCSFADSEKIVSNTLAFPFDLELFNFLKNIEFNEKAFSLAALEFGISIDLIRQKVKEYIEYHFLDRVLEGAIDYKDIDFIYNQMLNNGSQNEKNTKLS